VLAGGHVAALHATAELTLLLGGEQGDFVDFLEIGFQAAVGGDGDLQGNTEPSVQVRGVARGGCLASRGTRIGILLERS